MKNGPPRLAVRLLRRALPRGPRGDSILGDLREEYEARPTSIRRACWYWWTALRLGAAYALSRVAHSPSRIRHANMPILPDVKYAIRSLARAPGFTMTALATLALGIGANAAIFSVLNSVVLRPLPYHEPRDLVALWASTVVSKDVMVTARDNQESFSSVSGGLERRAALTGNGPPEDLYGIATTMNYFDVLGAPPALGRGFAPGEASPGAGNVVILSHGLWRRRFAGDRTVLGRTVQLGSDARVVVGVMPRSYEPLFQGAEFWIPMVLDPTDAVDYANTASVHIFARLGPGIDVSAAQRDVRRIATRIHEETPAAYSAEWVGSATVVDLHRTLVGDVRQLMFLLLGSVTLVLLIAAANVANLLLARSTGRTREIAMRIALGASRGRIIQQLLTESVVLGLGGGAAGLALALVSFGALKHSLPSSTPRLDTISIDFTVVAFTLVLSTLVGLVFGMVPALRASSRVPQHVLAQSSRRVAGTRRGHRFTSVLVATEMALAVVLVVGAGLMLESLWRLQRVDPGFRAENVWAMRLSPPEGRYGDEVSRVDYFRRVEERFRSLPGVVSAGSVTYLPMIGTSASSTTYAPEDRPTPEGVPRPFANFQFVSPGYFRTLGISMVRGRSVAASDGADAPPVAVINETLARRAWPGEDPVGQRLTAFGGGATATIVGVVGDTHQYRPDRAPAPEVFFPFAQLPWSKRLYLVVRTDGETHMGGAQLRDAVWSVDRDVPISRLAPMETVVTNATSDSRFNAGLFGLFAALAVLIGTIGVFGVVSYLVSQRTHEFGVRAALGARPGAIAGTALARGALASGIGIVIGVPLAMAGAQLLSSWLYGVSATDPIIFAAVPAVLAGVAVIACYLPARRAARVDPVIALRGG